MSRTSLACEGAYTAVRAAALAGVPKTTLYYWAKTGVVIPSVSPVRERLWSFADLLTVRMVHWLRKRKEDGGTSRQIPSTPMHQVRRALQAIDENPIDLWTDSAEGWECSLLVDHDGRIHLSRDGLVSDLDGQTPLPYLDLFAPFTDEGLAGPHLIRPRPKLRIVPGRVAGEPHIRGTRITSQAIAALAAGGHPVQQILDLYPGQDRDSIEQALDLEEQLSRSVGTAA